MTEDRMKYFRIAQALNNKKELKDLLKTKKLHFRGNRESFSLISLDKRTPEQGKGGFHDEKRGERFLLEEIDALLADNREKIDAEKSRPTREKELQAWIIDYAVNHDYRLPFCNGLTFLTSELAFKEPKTVNDILAIDQEGTLVVIELKSSRHKTTLEGQVEDFFDIIDREPKFFKKLVELLVPGRVWNGQKRGLIVWPASANRQFKSDWEHGITEVCYPERLENGKRQIAYDESGAIPFIEDNLP